MSTPSFKGEPTLVPMSGNAFQVWSGYQLSVPILFYNRDIINNIYLSYQPNVFINAPNAVILNPQSSVTMDGSRTIYAIGINGTGPLQIIPGGTQYQTSIPPIIPIVQSGSFNGAPATTVMAGNPFQPVTLVDVSSYASYDINLYMIALAVGTAGAVICAQITLQWFDDVTSGIPVFEEDWYFYAGRAVLASGTFSNPLAGCGPMHGRYMSVVISIPATATANATLQYINLFGSNRTVPYSDWRQNSQIVLPETNGFAIIPAGGSSFDNNLTSVFGGALGAGGNYWIPNSLYSGPVYYYFTLSATPTNAVVLINTQGLVGGQIVAGTSCPGVLFALAGTGGTTYTGTLLLPRAPTAWVIHGNAAASNVSAQMIAQQAA